MGIAIATTAGRVHLRVAGYADDTAIYLNGPAELTVALLAVDIFGAGSGIILNRAKTVAILFNPAFTLPGHGPVKYGYYQLISIADILASKLGRDEIPPKAGNLRRPNYSSGFDWQVTELSRWNTGLGLVDDSLPQHLDWAGGQCVADVSFLTGSPSASLRSQIRKTHWATDTGVDFLPGTSLPAPVGTG
ncbi:unnamed protein product [Phytophthora fragariaefolia]|uniref:Unnamed protein product n=1 Tax=Phytophthora fragariaefolia TaxID=1490495 RepID=A0A9W6XD88_9STRA|nr:unnamed protein product [Phytophthora fragariaefolia]